MALKTPECECASGLYPAARFLWIDLATIEAYYGLLSYLIPGLRFAWLARETRRHMTEELDFREEARNADKLREILAANSRRRRGDGNGNGNGNGKKHDGGRGSDHDDDEIIIPRVYPSLSGSRVLTQQWCPGVRVDDAAGLKAAGADVRRVGATIQRVFSDMIFVDGFVHCDPHPARARSNHAPPAPGARAAVGANSPR